MDMLKGNAIVEQLQLQKAKRSTKARRGHMDGMVTLHLKEEKDAWIKDILATFDNCIIRSATIPQLNSKIDFKNDLISTY